ncbi:unnamed protein product [Ectocarpus sp. 12 AP-2014]
MHISNPKPHTRSPPRNMGSGGRFQSQARLSWTSTQSTQGLLQPTTTTLVCREKHQTTNNQPSVVCEKNEQYRRDMKTNIAHTHSQRVQLSNGGERKEDSSDTDSAALGNPPSVVFRFP